MALVAAKRKSRPKGKTKTATKTKAQALLMAQAHANAVGGCKGGCGARRSVWTGTGPRALESRRCGQKDRKGPKDKKGQKRQKEPELKSPVLGGSRINAKSKFMRSGQTKCYQYGEWVIVGFKSARSASNFTITFFEKFNTSSARRWCTTRTSGLRAESSSTSRTSGTSTPRVCASATTRGR